MSALETYQKPTNQEIVWSPESFLGHSNQSCMEKTGTRRKPYITKLPSMLTTSDAPVPVPRVLTSRCLLAEVGLPYLHV